MNQPLSYEFLTLWFSGQIQIYIQAQQLSASRWHKVLKTVDI